MFLRLIYCKKYVLDFYYFILFSASVNHRKTIENIILRGNQYIYITSGYGVKLILSVATDVVSAFARGGQ